MGGPWTLHHHHQYHLPLCSSPTLLRTPSSSSFPRPSLLSFVARAEPQGSAEATPADATPSPAVGGGGGGGEGEGFGGPARSNKNKKKKKKGMGDRKIRRSTVVQNPQFLPNKNPRASASSTSTEQQEQIGVDEKAFLLAWLGLGVLIFVEGIALAASGFLPEEWDGFFVKFVYPTFTPTVFVFFGGTIAYGVSKYLQSEKK